MSHVKQMSHTSWAGQKMWAGKIHSALRLVRFKQQLGRSSSGWNLVNSGWSSGAEDDRLAVWAPVGPSERVARQTAQCLGWATKPGDFFQIVSFCVSDVLAVRRPERPRKKGGRAHNSSGRRLAEVLNPEFHLESQAAGDSVGDLTAIG